MALFFFLFFLMVLVFFNSFRWYCFFIPLGGIAFFIPSDSIAFFIPSDGIAFFIPSDGIGIFILSDGIAFFILSDDIDFFYSFKWYFSFRWYCFVFWGGLFFLFILLDYIVCLSLQMDFLNFPQLLLFLFLFLFFFLCLFLLLLMLLFLFIQMVLPWRIHSLQTDLWKQFSATSSRMCWGEHATTWSTYFLRGPRQILYGPYAPDVKNLYQRWYLSS